MKIINSVLCVLSVTQYPVYFRKNARRTSAFPQHVKASLRYPACEVWCIDTTYIFIEKSGNFTKQKRSYCNYKKKNLIKLLTICTGDGDCAVYFVVALGAESDKGISENSEVLRFLKLRKSMTGRQIILLSDKGFKMDVNSEGYCLIDGEIVEDVLFFNTGDKNDPTKNYEVARVRITVEQYYAGMKHQNRLFSKTIRNTMVKYLKNWILAALYFTNEFHKAFAKQVILPELEETSNL